MLFRSREFREQLLDDLEVERERGITIVAKNVSIRYKDVKINIIDLVNELNLPYKTFNDIQFQPHQHFNGVKSFTEFKNGYGVSVIRTEYSYGGNNRRDNRG